MTLLQTYVPEPLDGYELCHPIDREDFERINVSINGVSHADDWSPPMMRIIREDRGRSLSPSDAPWLGPQALVLKPPAIEALQLLLSTHGELLPVRCAGPPVFIYNVTGVIDALDENASEVVRFNGGRILRIDRYVFKPDRIGATRIFKIPNLRVSPTFVAEEFVQRWKSSGLKGLEFRRVWSQE